MPLDFKSALVGILSSTNRTVGTGFVVSDDGLIATCAHVVEAAGAAPGDTVGIFFYLSGDNSAGESKYRRAIVEPQWWRGPKAEDVAILRLVGPLPEKAAWLPLDSPLDFTRRTFLTFGFPQEKPDGLAGDGTIFDRVPYGAFTVWQVQSITIRRGFSGAPAWVVDIQCAVGMIVGTLESEIAFIIPTETLWNVCPPLRPHDTCPYRYLEAFKKEDARYFFGRQNVINELLEVVEKKPSLVAVLGPSGCGKSSLLHAGVIPQLEQRALENNEQWEFIDTRPTAVDELEAKGLPGATNNLVTAVQTWKQNHPGHAWLLLVIDQFEESFTLETSKREALFTQLLALLAAPLPVTVVFAMRNDFYSHLAQTQLLGKVAKTNRIDIPATVTEKDLTAIVRQPAQAVGLMFEDGLVEKIVADAMQPVVVSQKGATKDTFRIERQIVSSVLPLLEVTLTTLWKHRQNGTFTREVYDRIGGVAGGLRTMVDESYKALNNDEKRLIADRIFIELVQPGDERIGRPDVRRKRSLTELEREVGSPTVSLVVKQLIEDRLLVSGMYETDEATEEAPIELIHEVLLREWDLLRNLLSDENRKFVTWRREVAESVEAYAKTKELRCLLSGKDLTAANILVKNTNLGLSPNEQEFLRASRKQRAVIKSAIGFAISATILLLASAALMAWRFQAATLQAAHEQRIGAARQLAIRAELARDQQVDWLPRSGLLSIAALRRFQGQEEPSPETGLALRRVVSLLPRPLTHIVHEPGASRVALSFDGKYFAAAYGEKVLVWETTSNKLLATLGHPKPVLDVSLRRDGLYVATASEDGARVWDVHSSTEVTHMARGERMTEVALSSGNTYLAAVRANDAWVWNVNSSQEITRLRHDESITDLMFSLDEQRVATAGMDCIARVWDVGTGRQIVSLPHQQEVMAVALDLRGEYVATASRTEARVWQVNSGREVMGVRHEGGRYMPVKRGATLVEPGTVDAVILSSDAKYLATGSSDKTARMWDVKSKQEVLRMTHAYSVAALAYSADGKLMISAGMDSAVGIWEVTRGQGVVNRGGEVALLTHEYSVTKVALNHDGRYLATASTDKIVRVWDVSADARLHSFDHGAVVNAVAFSRDAKYVVTSSGNNIERVWDLSSGTEVPAQAHPDVVATLSTHRDDRYLITLSGEIVQVRNAASGKGLAVIIHEGGVNSAALNSDGRYLATAGTDGTARVWLWQDEDLIEEACSRLIYNLTPLEWREYFGEEHYQKICAKLPLHPYTLVEGRERARKGDMDTARWVFDTLKQQGGLLGFEPETEVRKLAAQGRIEQGTSWAERQKINEALNAFTEARELCPLVVIPSSAWETVCRFGGLSNRAADVLEACDRAVEAATDEQETAWRRDNRALVRLLTKNTVGALADFQAYVRWARDKQQYQEFVRKRERWLALLQGGQTPAEAEIIQELRDR
jgi:WD40 repeat protein